ncbi:MAG: Methyltransferase type 11 [Ignavibacteria bacterium]|nr:Methyltransferase type 11 [Ignavibacteria bacterium]
MFVDEFFEACTAPENRIIITKLGDIRGKKILELGCGAGEASVYFAKKGAIAIASDLSGGMLKVAQSLAAKHGVQIETKKFSTDHIEYPDETFDIVYAANLLHHVDIVQAAREANRVLKHGGLFVSWDPVQYNPLINIYRKKAMGVRTEDEHPIRIKDVKAIRQIYQNVETYSTWLSTLWIFLKFYLFDKVDPNKERYWKKIILEHKELEPTFNRLEKIDKFLLKLLPFLKWYCWNIVIIARKK